MGIKIDETAPVVEFEGDAGARSSQVAGALVSGFFEAGMMPTEIIPTMMEAMGLLMIILSPSKDIAVSNFEINAPNVTAFIEANWENRDNILNAFGVISVKPGASN